MTEERGRYGEWTATRDHGGRALGAVKVRVVEKVSCAGTGSERRTAPARHPS